MTNTLNSDDYQDFMKEFLEDYYTESEEYLSNIRRHLLVLETLVNQSEFDRTIVEILFRSFHTLKGLSGMVGIKEAEQLAHEMESYLRILRDDKAIITPQGFDALMEGTKALEEVIQAMNLGNKPSDITSILSKLNDLNSLAKSRENYNSFIDKKPEELEAELIENNQIQQDKKWHFVFAPTQELAAKGINVNIIRSRLQSIGNLISSTPRIKKDSDIVFDFILLTKEAEKTWQEWSQDGLCWDLDNSESEAKNLNLIEDIKAIERENQIEEIPEKEALSNTPKLTPNTQTPLISQSATVVRVDLPKLDDLMRMVGDLVISRARLEDYVRQIQNTLTPTQRRSFQEINLTIERQLRDLREGVMRVRLVPIGDAFARMQFVVRDLVRESKKDVALEITGQETEIDKFVVERMMDPLLHLVRNAISHGIETTAERIAKGKPPQGKIFLRAKTSGETVVIEIEDDGRGIELDKVIKKGKAKGLISVQEKDKKYDILTILELLCTPGFSTKDEADLVSGRGVGMGIVKNTVSELGGLLNLTTEKDHGTCYTIQLPLTLAIADALIITIEGQTFAIPQTSVREITDIQTSEITNFENKELFTYRDKVLSLVRLGRYFGLETHPERQPPSPGQPLRVAVVGNDFSSIGIVIDRVIGLREIVVRPLTDPFVQVTGIAGATELGDGRVVLILDISALIRTAGKIMIS